MAPLSFLIISAFAVSPPEPPGLEPYLEDNLRALVAQIRSDETPYLLKRRALRKALRIAPDHAPDTLVEFLYHPGDSFNEFTGRQLFEHGRPNSKTKELLKPLAQGRRGWTKEQIIAFSHALSWRGNKDAVPALKKMVEEKWDTAPAIPLCLARIADQGDPTHWLELPAYVHGKDFRGFSNDAFFSGMLRRSQNVRLNQLLAHELGNPPLIYSLWEGKGVYALAWPGNKVLATHYLNTIENLPQLPLAAARTRDPNVLDRIRPRFHARTEELLRTGKLEEQRHSFIRELLAGMEAADGSSAPILKKLLEEIDRIKEEVAKRPLIKGQRIMDPAGPLREIVLKGLCLNPNPRNLEVVARYLDDPKHQLLCGVALLRSGKGGGLELVIDAWEKDRTNDQIAEWFLLYSGENVLPKSTGYPDAHPTIKLARQWYRDHGKTLAFRERLEQVNKSPLIEELLEPLRLWP